MARFRVVALSDDGTVERVLEDHIEVTKDGATFSELRERARLLGEEYAARAGGAPRTLALEWFHELSQMWQRPVTIHPPGWVPPEPPPTKRLASAGANEKPKRRGRRR